MKRVNAGRLKGVEARFSPRLHVIMLLEKAKASGSVIEFARGIASSAIAGADQLMTAVEKSARDECRGMTTEQVDRHVRARQMEAMFLNRLVWVCNETVLTQSPLWEAQAGMLMFAGLYLSGQDDTADEQVFEWCRAVEHHWVHVESVAKAIDTIAREYLGTDPLLPNERRRLEKTRADAAKLLRAALVCSAASKPQADRSDSEAEEEQSGLAEWDARMKADLDVATKDATRRLWLSTRLEVFQRCDNQHMAWDAAIELLGDKRAG